MLYRSLQSSSLAACQQSQHRAVVLPACANAKALDPMYIVRWTALSLSKAPTITQTRVVPERAAKPGNQMRSCCLYDAAMLTGQVQESAKPPWSQCKTLDKCLCGWLR